MYERGGRLIRTVAPSRCLFLPRRPAGAHHYRHPPPLTSCHNHHRSPHYYRLQPLNSNQRRFFAAASSKRNGPGRSCCSTTIPRRSPRAPVSSLLLLSRRRCDQEPHHQHRRTTTTGKNMMSSVSSSSPAVDHHHREGKKRRQARKRERGGAAAAGTTIVAGSAEEGERNGNNNDNNNNDTAVIDKPCWGSPTRCSLQHLLQQIKREDAILHESDDFVVLCKPPDLRMDGPFPATVHKLLTYWYPPPSLLRLSKEAVPEQQKQQQQQTQDSSDQNATAATGEIDSNSSHNEALLQRIAALAEFPDAADNELRPCHQLDYATSGVLLVARNRRANAQAQSALERRSRGINKSYAAVLCGHVHCSCHTNSPSASWPVLTPAQRDNLLADTEERYRRSRKKRRKETFPGYMPPFAMLAKWQGQQQRAAKQRNNSNATANSGNSKKNKRKKKKNAVRELTDAEWQSVWKDLFNGDDEQQQQLGINTTTTWKDLKRRNDQATMDRFARAADRYNDLVRAQVEQAHQETELPPFFFCVDNEDDSNPEDDTFYIYAPLAQTADDFAMRIHPDYQQASPPSSSLKVGDADSLDFKPSLTKCTVRRRTYLAAAAATAAAGGDDDPEQRRRRTRTPVTLVDLEPRTGRRHQLRVHAALAGHPVVGDQTYAAPAAHGHEHVVGRSDAAPRLCLHSARLRLALMGGGAGDRNDIADGNANDSKLDNETTVLDVRAASPFLYNENDDCVDIRIFSTSNLDKKM